MTLQTLRRKLPKAWCLETRSDICEGPFDPNRPADAQCVPTALIVQDLFGGEIIRVMAGTIGSHYYNRLPDGRIVDLTKRQFPKGTKYSDHEVYPRWKMLDSPEAIRATVRERYELLRHRLGLT